MSTTLTGNAIIWASWLALRQRVILEEKLKASGLKFRRSSLAVAKRRLGLPKGTSKQAVIDALTVRVAQAQQQIRPGEVTHT